MSRPTKTKISALVTVLTAVLLLAPELFAAKKSKTKPRRVTAEEQMAFGVDMAKRGLWREALFRFQRARQLDAGTPRVLNNMAVAFEAVGDFDRALEYYKLALESDSGNKDLRKNYARFVEFYQSFRPTEGGKEAAQGTGGETEKEGGGVTETTG